MKIAFFEIKLGEKDCIEKNKLMVKHELFFYDHILSKNNIPDETAFDIVSVFVNSEVDSEVLNKLPNLKMIATRSTGFDHVDLSVAKKRDILVANVPTYGENTVAEFTFALLLSLSRKILESRDRVKEEGSFSPDGLTGFDLNGKTLGVIGTGKIGAHVIKIANGFGMKVVASDPFPNQGLVKDLGFEYMPLLEVLKMSDIITLHVPYMKETHHLINKKNIGLIKKGAYLINTARGGIVETESLVEALKRGDLAGAGLDVLEEENAIKNEPNLAQKRSKEHVSQTLLADHVLIDMPNVIVTPHNAFNTTDALGRILDTTIENINLFIKGKPMNTVK